MLTPRKAEVYDFILTYFREHHCVPSLREIAAEVLSSPNPSAAHNHITRLIRKGCLEESGRDSYGSRYRSYRFANADAVIIKKCTSALS